MLKPAKTGVKQAKMDLFAYLRPPKTYLKPDKSMGRGGQRYKRPMFTPIFGYFAGIGTRSQQSGAAC
jgi:hypothetical protein